MSLRPSRAAACLAALAVAACEDHLVHAFGAYRYDRAGDCLEATGAVDVVAGADPGSCDRTRCWTSPAGEIYVTTTACDAPPDYREGTADAAGTPCALALSALWRDGGGACGGGDGG